MGEAPAMVLDRRAARQAVDGWGRQMSRDPTSPREVVTVAAEPPDAVALAVVDEVSGELSCMTAGDVCGGGGLSGVAGHDAAVGNPPFWFNKSHDRSNWRRK
mmetsp:Transcript_20580/g.58804  ORF Transcript_20580/g.58804 Transcript_20580/m.58804 type:complete len:102 (-) Transcript_20580:18-323(-)